MRWPDGSGGKRTDVRGAGACRLARGEAILSVDGADGRTVYVRDGAHVLRAGEDSVQDGGGTSLPALRDGGVRGRAARLRAVRRPRHAQVRRARGVGTLHGRGVRPAVEGRQGIRADGRADARPDHRARRRRHSVRVSLLGDVSAGSSAEDVGGADAGRHGRHPVGGSRHGLAEGHAASGDAARGLFGREVAP